MSAIEEMHFGERERLASSAASLGEPFGLAVLDALPVGVLLLDARRPGLPIVSANRAACELTGYPLEEILRHGASFLEAAGSDPEVVRELRAALAGGLDFHGEILGERRDGSTFWSELT